MKKVKGLISVIVAAACLAGGTAHAALTAFQQFNGNVGSSADGFGSTSDSGTISASVPVGSTVLAAYLYTSTFSNPSFSGVGGTLAGNSVTYTSLGQNPTACCNLIAGRSDVTSIIKPLIDGGPGGIYNFSITETSASQDGEALVVVYSNPLLPTSTVGILDGFASAAGDMTTINFAQPLNPVAPGFFAEMALGIGFSCCTQASTVRVNGTTITEQAGNMDDSGVASNGALITVGGFDDPFSLFLPSYVTDHERYNLVPYITAGDMAISIETINASRDDNIFLALFNVVGEAGINTPPPTGNVPEPGTLALMGIAFIGLRSSLRRKARHN